MTGARRDFRRGSAALEFTLVAIPLLFVLISIAELGRGMWMYHTLAFAVKEGARYAIVHGQNCAAASSSCAGTVQAVAQTVRSAGVGLDPSQLQVSLQSASAKQSCNPLNSCLTNTAQWPPYPDNAVGLPVTVSGTILFRSAISMFWPGSGTVSAGAVNLGAASAEEIRY
jgi:Flp pilus assembly protein TadG